MSILFLVDLARGQTVTSVTVDIGNGAVTGGTSSLAVVAGNPAIAYFNSTDGKLMFARNSNATGTGTWTVSVVDIIGAGSGGTPYPSLVYYGLPATPAISYYDSVNGDLKFARNSASDGSGTWTISIVDSPGNVGTYSSLAAVAGNPAISYYNLTNGDLKFARCSASDGSGPWTITTVESAGVIGQYSSLGIVNGNPAISYYDATNGDLKFARNTAADGSGSWTIVTAVSSGFVGLYSSMTVINGNPAISYFDITSGVALSLVRATDANGSAWSSPVTVNNTVNYAGPSSLNVINGNPAISFYDGVNADLKFVRSTDVNGIAGSWSGPVTVDSVGSVGKESSLVVVSGTPAISYFDETNGDLKFARSSDASGATGTWTATTADSGFQSGDVGRHSSHAIIQGNPAVAYYDASNRAVKFARNSQADGSGTWTISTVTTAGDVDSRPLSLAVVAGNPAIVFYNPADHTLKFARNSASDGTGTWTVSTAFDLGGFVAKYLSLSVISGNPAVSYDLVVGANASLHFARSNTSDGSGTWVDNNIDTSAILGQFTSLAVVNGTPAISYSGAQGLKFARSPTANGSGGWSKTIVDPTSTSDTCLTVVNGNPAITYISSGLKFARNSVADGTGAWTLSVVDNNLSVTGGLSAAMIGSVPAATYLASSTIKFALNSAVDGTGVWTNITIPNTLVPVASGTSLIALTNGKPAVAYCQNSVFDLIWSTFAFHEIAIEQPAGSELADGASKNITVALGFPQTLSFTIRNYGVGEDITGLTVTKDGTDAGDFVILTNPVSPIAGPLGSTNLLVQFNPNTAGAKTAALHIASNDADENPYDINLNGTALSFSQDTDGDGMNDASEFQLANLGFNWQVAQPSLVQTLSDNITRTGIVQSIYINQPFISKNPATGQFKLTIGVQKTTNLSNAFAPFPMTAPQTSINGNGELEFQFTTPDPAEFFLLQAK